MAYSITNITTIQECDELITKVQQEKEVLDFRQLSLEFRLDAYAERALQVEAEHTRLSNELISIDNTLATLQPGEIYDEFQARKTKINYKIFINDERRNNYNSISLVLREADVEQVKKQVLEIDNLLTTLQTHRSTL